MKQSYLFEPIPCEKYDLLSRKDLVTLVKGYEDLISQVVKHNKQLTEKLIAQEHKQFLLGEQLIQVKHNLFGKSSEKSEQKPLSGKPKKEPRKRVLLPSERYPELDVIEKRVELEEPPVCPCCAKEMMDSGLTEDSEYLTVIPKRYYVVKQRRVKYRCSACQDSLVTTPSIPRVTPGSSYSDEMVVDVALSKYCDLIPVDRYVQMAARGGVKGIPANSLIEGTHQLANFLHPLYLKIKDEVMSAKVLHADETPHRMLEGSDKDQWYLWGFSTNSASYFEAKDTRSSSVAADIIKDAACEYLVSDVYSGYHKAVSDSNIYRRERRLSEITNIYCNAHARRKFKEAWNAFPNESRFFLRCYQKIYHLEKTKNRKWQKIYYRAMEKMALKVGPNYPAKSSLVRAFNYFTKNLIGLTTFLNHEDIPIDNNAQERLLRSPVVGRKTWYGTHSPKGAQTSALLFSLVESCKLNKVNPRDYFKNIVHAIHEKRSLFTPSEYLKIKLEITA